MGLALGTAIFAGKAAASLPNVPKETRLEVKYDAQEINRKTRLTRGEVQYMVAWVNANYFASSMNAWVNDAASLVFVESGSGYGSDATANAQAKRVEPDGRTSYGLMQVLTGTAGDLYKKGYKAFSPSGSSLSTPAGGIYFGLAYLHYLDKYFNNMLHSRQDIIRAYNGGQGWKLSKRGVSMTANYYAKYTKQKSIQTQVA